LLQYIIHVNEMQSSLSTCNCQFLCEHLNCLYKWNPFGYIIYLSAIASQCNFRQKKSQCNTYWVCSRKKSTKWCLFII